MDVCSVPCLGDTVLGEFGSGFQMFLQCLTSPNLYLEERCNYTSMLAFPLSPPL